MIWSLQALDDSFQIAKRNLDHIDLYRTLIRLNMVVIGIAFEGKRLLKGLRTTLKVNWLGLILSLSIVLLSMMPLLMDYVVRRSSGGFSIPNPISTGGIATGKEPFVTVIFNDEEMQKKAQYIEITIYYPVVYF